MSFRIRFVQLPDFLLRQCSGEKQDFIDYAVKSIDPGGSVLSSPDTVIVAERCHDWAFSFGRSRFSPIDIDAHIISVICADNVIPSSRLDDRLCGYPCVVRAV